MIEYNLSNNRLPDNLAINIANQYVVESACQVDSQVILVKAIGSVPENRKLTPDSDFDYFVLSSSSQKHDISVANKSGPKFRCLRGSSPRPIQVHWYCLDELLNQIIQFDFGAPVWHRLARCYQYVVWYDLCSDHAPLYATDHGNKIFDNSSLFINRDSVSYVLESVKKTTLILNNIPKWQGCHYKFAKSNLMGLDMCIKAFEGNLFPYDVKQVPRIPSQHEYRLASSNMMEHATSYDVTSLPPQDNESINLLRE